MLSQLACQTPLWVQVTAKIRGSWTTSNLECTFFRAEVTRLRQNADIPSLKHRAWLR